MKPNYFKSLGALANHAENYPANSFSLEHNPRKCLCEVVRCSYEVTDKQDNDILEILVFCPVCANQPKNRQ